MEHLRSDPLEGVVPQIRELYHSKVTLQSWRKGRPSVAGEGGEQNKVFNRTPVILLLKVVESSAVHQLSQILRKKGDVARLELASWLGVKEYFTVYNTCSY